MLPALHHTADDAGRYITAGIVIARDPDTGVYNASYHRLMLAGPQPRRHPARLRPPSARGVRARPEEGPASAGRGLHRLRPRAALHRGDDGLADAGERRRARRRRRLVRPAAAGGEGGHAGPAGAGRERDRARGRAEVRRGGHGRPVRRVRRLSGAGRSRPGAGNHRRDAPDQADLSRHQRLRPRDRGAAQIRAGGEPAQGAARRGADRHRRRDDGRRPAPLPRRRSGEEDRARPTTACSATPSWPRSAR